MLENKDFVALPVTIWTKQSDQGDFAARKVTETFSEKYYENPFVPESVIQELATLFSAMNGEFSPSVVTHTDSGFCAFCDFLVANGGGLESIYQFTSSDAGRFFEFCRTCFPDGWKRRYMNCRSRFNEVLDIIWPIVVSEHSPTEGFSVGAVAMIRESLKKEIDHMRCKIGRLDRDLKSGKVLEIDLSVNRLRADKVNWINTTNSADIIKTIRHYCPDFPLEREEVFSKTKTQMNPGQYLIQQIILSSNKKRNTGLAKIIGETFKSLDDFYDYYFPTSYDATCILMYWALTTGWNRQVIESVGCDELNLRFERNSLMDAWSENHAIITGKKIRAQPKGKPKIFSHISDKSDPYGLFNVLNDFYTLTKTIRSTARPLQGRCIIMGLQSSGTDPIGMFGPGVKGSYFSQFKNDSTTRFFQKYKIYDDEESVEQAVRIETLNWRQLRTSYETILEDMNLPLYVRQILMGHKSIDTTMFPYGSDRHATKIQLENLNKTLAAVHEDFKGAKYFQGAFLPPERRLKNDGVHSQKVVSIARTDWRDNIIMLCENSRKPTWLGHELYIKSGAECTFLGKCLFCNRCLIGMETLPYLAQWDMDINEYFDEYGDWDTDLEWLKLKQAINEALDLWALEISKDDVKRAKAMSMSADFQRIPLDIWHLGSNSFAD